MTKILDFIDPRTTLGDTGYRFATHHITFALIGRLPTQPPCRAGLIKPIVKLSMVRDRYFCLHLTDYLGQGLLHEILTRKKVTLRRWNKYCVPDQGLKSDLTWIGEIRSGASSVACAWKKCQGMCGSRLPLLAPGRISPVGDKPCNPALVSRRQISGEVVFQTNDRLHRTMVHMPVLTCVFQSLSVTFLVCSKHWRLFC